MKIDDGTGHGFQMKVDDENLAHVLATIVDIQHHTNHVHGKAYTLDLDGVTAGQDADYFVYMLNTDDDDLIVSSITLWAATDKDDDNVEAWIGKALASVANETAVVPANLNGGCTLNAAGTFYVSDGTAGGITTLTGGRQAGRMKFYSKPTKWEKSSHWLIPKNSTFCLKTEKDNKYTGYISFYFHND